MQLAKFFRSVVVICLTCILLLNNFAAPAFANSPYYFDNDNSAFTDSSPSWLSEFGGGFWRGLGSTLGGAAGVVAVCYVVDAGLAAVAPPAAAALLPMCPGIGATVGGMGGLVTTSVVHP